MPGGVGGRAWGGQAEQWNPSAELGVPPAQEGPSVVSRMLSPGPKGAWPLVGESSEPKQA